MPIRKLSAAALIVLCVSVCCGQGTYYQAYFHDSVPRRLADLPKLKTAEFRRLASSFKPSDGDKGQILDLCQQTGMKVCYETNTGSQAEHKKNFDAYSCIDLLQPQDDIDLAPGNTPDKLKALIASWRPFMRADMKILGTFSRGAKPETWANQTDIAALQFYIYKEGTLRKAWEIIRAWRVAHTGKLWIHPYLGKNSIPFALRNDPVWKAQEYTPLAYNEALIWLSLCAGTDDGIDGMLFYSAWDINASYPPDNSYIVERWDLLPGYAEMFRQIRTFDKFLLTTKPVQFESADKRIVGATWTLPTGEALRVEVDTYETKPDVAIKPTPAPTPPIVTQLKITSGGPVTIEKQ